LDDGSEAVMMTPSPEGSRVVVTEWQVDLDAHLENRPDAGEAERDAQPFAAGDLPAWMRRDRDREREESHVALEIDPVDEGLSLP
jgi:hypothetical protein